MSVDPPSGTRTKTAWLAFGLLAILVALAWANGLRGEFTYDDKVEVVGNRAIRWLENWRAVLGYNVSRPVVIFSWALDWRLWGDSPLGYHVFNTIIHILNAGLILLVGEELARRLDRPRPLLLAWIAAAIWAVHPMCTEAVTYITGRSESLCAFFILGSVLEWIRWRREGDGFHLLISFLAFLLALGTKEVAITVPLLLVLTDLLPSTRPRGRSWWLAQLPYWGLLVLGISLRWAVNGVLTTDQWLRPVGVQILTEMEVILRYIGLWLLPVGQTVFHDFPAATSLTEPAALLAPAVWMGLLALALSQRHRYPALLPGLGWFLVILLPSSSFIPLKETMAEHRAYLSGWGLIFAIVLGLAPIIGGKKRVSSFIVVTIVLLCMACTFQRNRIWRTDIGLWSEATRRNPESAEAWYGYGDTLRVAQSWEEAAVAFGKSTELDPEYLDAWNNLGIVLAEQDRPDEARAAWMSVLRRHPTYCKGHNNLAWLEFRQKKWETAMAEFRTTLDWCPNDAQAHYGLAQIYDGPLKDLEKEKYYYEQVLALDPHFPAAAYIRQKLLELTW